MSFYLTLRLREAARSNGLVTRVRLTWDIVTVVVPTLTHAILIAQGHAKGVIEAAGPGGRRGHAAEAPTGDHDVGIEYPVPRVGDGDFDMVDARLYVRRGVEDLSQAIHLGIDERSAIVKVVIPEAVAVGSAWRSVRVTTIHIVDRDWDAGVAAAGRDSGDDSLSADRRAD